MAKGSPLPVDAGERIRSAIGDADARELSRDVIGAFREHQLLIASAGIAFRVFLALVTGTLCLLGLVGFFGFTELWRTDLAPDVRAAVSGPAFEVIDQAVVHVLENKEVFWVTFGAAIALWQISGVVRAAGQTLNRIYGVDEDRPLADRLRSSVAAACLIGLLLLATLAIVRLGPLAFDELLGDSTVVAIVGFVVRWVLAALLLLIAVGVVARIGPAVERPLRWVSFGSALTVGGWIVTSIAFGVYLSEFASASSVYGALLAAFLLVEYLYVAAVVFIGGLVVDRLVQKG